MFKDHEEIEKDFMDYGNEEAPKHNAKDGSFLSKVIQFLSVIVLLGIVGFMGMFGYKYLQKDTLENKSKTIEPKVDTKNSQSISPVTQKLMHSATKEDLGKEKMYTQEEMQAIVKMLMEQMQAKTQKNIQKVSVDNNDEEIKSATSVKKDTQLVAALNNIEADQLDEIDEEVPTHANQDSIYKTTTSKNDKKVDRYNKVVVQTNKSNYDELANLSLEMGNVLKDAKTTDKKQSSYTNSIKKEVKTRVNEMRVIIVKEGDSLSKIAKRAYGSAQAFDRIMEANPDLIKNPNHIYVGQRLRVPVENN